MGTCHLSMLQTSIQDTRLLRGCAGNVWQDGSVQTQPGSMPVPPPMPQVVGPPPTQQGHCAGRHSRGLAALREVPKQYTMRCIHPLFPLCFQILLADLSSWVDQNVIFPHLCVSLLYFVSHLLKDSVAKEGLCLCSDSILSFL